MSQVGADDPGVPVNSAPASGDAGIPVYSPVQQPVAGDPGSLLPLVAHLENSSDTAVSPAGAVGRYQIMPATAKAYGFDPSKLTDPAYNENVARTVLGDLSSKYGGDLQKTLVAYNAGPSRVNALAKANGNRTVLPNETQRYLTRAEQYLGYPLNQPVPVAAPSAPVQTAALSLPQAQVPKQSTSLLGRIGSTIASSIVTPAYGAAANDDDPGIPVYSAPAAAPAAASTDDPGVPVFQPAVSRETQPKQGIGQVAGESIVKGLREGLTSVKQAATPFKDMPADTTPADYTAQLLAMPASEGMKHPDWYVAKMLNGLAASSPSLALSVAGAWAGGAAGPLGALGGGAAGFGVGSVVQEIAPAYQQARARGMTHDEAVDFAIKQSSIAGAFGTLMGLVPGASLWGKTVSGALRRPISEALFQIFGAQPALMVAQQEAQGVAAGQQPSASDLAGTYVTGVGTGVGMVGAHMAGSAGAGAVRRLIPRATPPAATAAAAIPGATVEINGKTVQVAPMPSTDAMDAAYGGPPAAAAGEATEQAPGSETPPAATPKGGQKPKQPKFEPLNADSRAQIAQLTDGVPPEMVGAAQADVAEMNAAAPKGYDLFQAIKDLGGIMTRPKNEQGENVRSREGGEVEASLKDVPGLFTKSGEPGKRLGIINNETGMEPDKVREALQEKGWFGVGSATAKSGTWTGGEGEEHGDDIQDFYDLISKQAHGEPVYHPESETTDQLLRRAQLERDWSEAGIGSRDHPDLAAAKLAYYRQQTLRSMSPEMGALRARADALGLPHDRYSDYDDLQADVIEREAVREEADRSYLDQAREGLDDEYARSDPEASGDLWDDGSSGRAPPETGFDLGETGGEGSRAAEAGAGEPPAGGEGAAGAGGEAVPQEPQLTGKARDANARRVNALFKKHGYVAGESALDPTQTVLLTKGDEKPFRVFRIKSDGTKTHSDYGTIADAASEFGPDVKFQRAPKDMFATEPGAVDAQGNPLPQTIVPGAEATEAQRRAAMTERQRAEMAARQQQSKLRRGGQEEPGGMFAEPDKQKTLFQRAPTFFSALTRGVEALKLSRAPASDWLGAIKNLAGVKQEERDWSGVEDWLRGQKGAVTKAEVLDHLRENEVRVREVQKGTPRKPSGGDINAVVSWAQDNVPHKRNVIDTAAMAAARGDKDGLRFLKEAEVPQRLLAPFEDQFVFPGDNTKFSTYTLPGGENYRELLMTLPRKPRPGTMTDAEAIAHVKELAGLPADQPVPAGMRTWFTDRVEELSGEKAAPSFQSSHFDEPNILAHVRFDDRTGPNGEKVLHVAEIQSDWHQKGRRQGYQGEPLAESEVLHAVQLKDHHNLWRAANAAGESPTMQMFTSEAEAKAYADHMNEAAARAHGVPDAPFKSSWQELAAKRMLRYAAEHGYDRLSWDTGETQADRYDLSKQVDHIGWARRKDGTYDISVYGKNGERHEKDPMIVKDKQTPQQLAEIIGKDATDKIIAQKPEWESKTDPLHEAAGTLLGNDLKVGGEGMKGFYDKILPSFLNKYAKKWGAKVEDSKVGQLGNRDKVAASIYGKGETYDALPPELKAQVDKVISENGAPVHSIPITDAMRESVMEGQALFKRGGASDEHPGEQRVASGLVGREANMADRLTPVIAEVARELNRIVPGIEQRVMATMRATDEHGGSVLGASFRRGTGQVVAWSLESPDAVRTARHEAVHALRQMGLIRPQEWSILTRAATAGDWINKYNIRRDWPGLTHEQALEEAIAEHFADWRRNPAEPLPNFIHLIYGKIAAAMEAIARAARRVLGMDATPDDILHAMDTGEIGRRGNITSEGEPALQRVPKKPMTEKQFYREYAQHIDIRGRQKGNALETREAILRDGFKKGANVNAMPPWRGGEPRDVAEAQHMKPQAGDVVYLAPKEAWRDRENGMEVQDGWKPKPYEAIVVKDPNRSMYQNYLEAFRGEPALQRAPRLTAAQRKAASEEAERRKAMPAKVISRFDNMLGGAPDHVGEVVTKTADRFFSQNLKDVGESVRKALDPMATGAPEAQAQAKDFANALRATDFEWARMDKFLTENFTPEQRQRMALALDLEGVEKRAGREAGQNGLAGLSKPERDVVEELNRRQEAAYRWARSVGIHDSEGLEFHFPRMVVGKDGQRVTRATTDQQRVGGNLTVTTGQMRQRKYEKIEDTEAAAKLAFGPDAHVVRDIRAVGVATNMLNRAIAGRKLVDGIEEAGKKAGVETISDDPSKANDPQWVHWDTPALTKWVPREYKADPETGKLRPLKDEDGRIIFKTVPIYVLKGWDGPLRAVLSHGDPLLWRSLMGLKAKAVGAIMYNPLVHNQVIFGKAFPSMVRHSGVLGALSFKMYRDGYKMRQDNALMQRALLSGMVPINSGYARADAGLVDQMRPLGEPPQGWTGKLVTKAAELMHEPWKEPTKEWLSKAHDFVANKLLWNRIADLQTGIWKAMSDHYVEQGYDQATADKVASYFANQYAGAVPREAISNLARGILNGILFSRSFHQTNIGGIKAVIGGMPSDIRAQITRDAGENVAKQAQGAVRAQAATNLFLDILSAYGFRILGATAVGFMLGKAINWPWQNEPGKTDKLQIGQEADGTNVYMNIPFGKYASEVTDWATEPLDYAKTIMFGPTRLLAEYWNNDMGFGRKAFDPYAKGIAGFGENLWRGMGNIAESVMPMGTINAFKNVWEAPTAQDRRAAESALAGVMTGFTVSHGAPGGAASGVLMNAREEHQFRVDEALPDIRKQIRRGDVQGARAAMTKLGMSRFDINSIVKATLNPSTRTAPRALKSFNKYATPEQRQQMQQQLQRH